MAFNKKAWQKAYSEDMRATLKTNRLCLGCKRAARPERDLCQACADKHALAPAYQPTEANRKKWRKYRRAIAAQGKCVKCFIRRQPEGPRGTGATKWRCEDCAEAHRASSRPSRTRLRRCQCGLVIDKDHQAETCDLFQRSTGLGQQLREVLR